MVVEWPASTLAAVDAGVRDGSGVVLAGSGDADVTALAGAAADRLGDRYPSVEWVRGTAAGSAVPFGAFGGVFDVPATGRTTDLLRAARAALSDGRLLIVDHAHRLDALSATLLYQLALAGAPLIVTVDPTAALPDAVSALLRDAVLPHIDVAGIDQAAPPVPDAARRALEFLAVAEPLPAATLSGLAPVDDAVAAGVAVLDGDRVRAAHPREVDAVAAKLTEAERRGLRTELVSRLAADPPGDVVGRLRLALLALDSDQPVSTTLLTAAAEDALRIGALSCSERLGRAAAAREPGLAARLPLSYALAFQGRGRDADAVLAEVDPAGLAEDELMAWALPRAANQFWMLSEPERATAFLRTIRGRVSSPTARTTLDALSATFAMNAGRPREALRIATEVLASPAADDTAVGWAGAAAALSAARIGRFDDVDGLAERAMTAGHPGLLRFTSGFGQTTALGLACELGAAQALARQLTDVAYLQQPGRAIGEVLVADVLIARGSLDAAAALLRDAAAVLAPTGYSWGPLASMLLARTLGEQGATADAAIALSRAESRHGLKSMLFAPELALARAWTRASRGDEHGAVAAAREAARAAERGGQSAVALRALHDAVRLGDLRAVDGLMRLGVDCAFGRLTLRHARALVAGDAAGLTGVSEAFAAVGLGGAARDAAAQAQRLGG